MKNRGTNHAVTARSANFSSYLNHFVITNHLGLTGVQVFMQEWILGLMHKVQPRRIHSTAWPRVGLPSSPYADKHVLLLLAISGIYRDKERKHYSIIITSLNFINFECCGQNKKQSLKRRSHSLYLYVEFSVHDKWDFFFFFFMKFKHCVQPHKYQTECYRAQSFHSPEPISDTWTLLWKNSWKDKQGF